MVVACSTASQEHVMEDRQLAIAGFHTVGVPTTNTSPPEINIGIYQKNEVDDCLEEIHFGWCREEDARLDEHGVPRCPDQRHSIERKDIFLRIIAYDDGGINDIEVRAHANGINFQQRDGSAVYTNYDSLIQAIVAPRDYDPGTTRWSGVIFSDWITLSESTTGPINIFVVASNIGGVSEHHHGTSISQTFDLELID